MGSAPTLDFIDDFAGPGGWDLGAALLGLEGLGVEWDQAACDTAVAAGFKREKADVSTHDGSAHRGIPLYIASPPCTLFSSAGKGTGRDAIDVLANGIRRMFAGEDCRAEIRETIYRDTTLPACKHGHEFTKENTRLDPNGARVCRACQRRRTAERNATKKEQAA